VPDNFALKYMHFKDSIGGEIRRRRLKLGLRGKDLAETCGVTTDHILGVERGDRQPSLKILYIIITEGLEISVDTFFRGLEGKK
jgi:transcriptional regulator with XRE-family HTH domain